MLSELDRELLYKISMALVAVLVAAAIGFAVFGNQPFIAIGVLAGGFAFLLVVRGRYRTVVLRDERTSRLGEKAASTTFWIFLLSAAAVIGAEFVLEDLGIGIQSLKSLDEPLGQILIGLMRTYSAVHSYYSRRM